MTWELDLWGNLRWAKDKSIAQFLGSIEAQRALKMSIVSEVAQAYFESVSYTRLQYPSRRVSRFSAPLLQISKTPPTNVRCV